MDIILIGLSLYISWFIRIYSGWMEAADHVLPFADYMSPLILIIPIYIFLYNFFNLYKPYRTKSLYDELGNLLKANVIGILFFLTYLFVYRIVDYSRIVLILFTVFTISLSFIERMVIRGILRNLRKNDRNLKHIVFVGYSDLAVEYSKRIMQNKHWGYRIKGIFDNNTTEKTVDLYSSMVQVLGKYKDLESYIINNSVDEIVITIDLDDYRYLEEIVATCEKQGVFARIIPDYYKVIPAKPYIEDIDGLPVISLRNIPLNDLVKRSFKRMIDVMGSLFGIIALSPMFMVIALLIKISSKGPVIYKQVRVGLNRKEFVMYKFRSMVVQDISEEKSGWTTKEDPRVTKVGAFIRKTSLDEFPQLINVLKGEMSLVGPRPERPQFVEQFREEIAKYMVKHQVRPGMTGWAQIHGLRGDTSIKKRIEYDLYYIENWSLKLEIRILALTFIKGFTNKNAY